MKIFNHGRKILFLQNHTADVIKIDFCILPFDNRLTADEDRCHGIQEKVWVLFDIFRNLVFKREYTFHSFSVLNRKEIADTTVREWIFSCGRGSPFLLVESDVYFLTPTISTAARGMRSSYANMNIIVGSRIHKPFERFSELDLF